MFLLRQIWTMPTILDGRCDDFHVSYTEISILLKVCERTKEKYYTLCIYVYPRECI